MFLGFFFIFLFFFCRQLTDCGNYNDPLRNEQIALKEEGNLMSFLNPVTCVIKIILMSFVFLLFFPSDANLHHSERSDDTVATPSADL